MGPMGMTLALLLAGTTAGAAERALAELQPTQGSQVRGKIRFTPVDGGVKVTGQVTGLTPGRHGFHVHQWGDCSSPRGSSAGDHWNPDANPHGAPQAVARHVGDMGNIDADAQGQATIGVVLPGVVLTGDKGIAGRSVIIHAKQDDLKTQPSGNAGDRLACGVIGLDGAEPAAGAPAAGAAAAASPAPAAPAAGHAGHGSAPASPAPSPAPAASPLP